MRLDELHVRRFKSLYDINLSLQDFSVLTGPNGAGKSNLVDAIAFLGEVYSFGIEYAVGRAGGIDAISFREVRRTTIGVEFTIRASFSINDIRRGRLPFRRRGSDWDSSLENEVGQQVFIVSHRFTLKPAGIDSASDYAVSTETLEMALKLNERSGDVGLFKAMTSNEIDGEPSIQILDLSSEGLNPIEIAAADVLMWGVERFSTDPFRVAAGASIIDWLKILPPIREFQARMSFIRAYRLNPSGCREPGVLTPNATLFSNGGNLPAVVARLTKLDTETWGRILENMKQLLPELQSIKTVPSPGRGLVLQFQEQGRGRPWSADEVSDGTIQALAMLTALNDKRAPIIVVEEPEYTVHPWVLRRFVEQSKAVNGKQVVLTTHSPVLLKLVRPEDVFVLWRNRGRTKVKSLVNLLPDVQRLYREEGFDVFELYDSGLIPQTVPAALDGHE